MLDSQNGNKTYSYTVSYIYEQEKKTLLEKFRDQCTVINQLLIYKLGELLHILIQALSF